MSPTNPHKDDWKLLLAIGGFVVAGAAGIAILAGIGAGREAEAVKREESAKQMRAALPAPTLDTAARPEPGVDEKIPGSTIDTEITAALDAAPDEPVAEPFIIDTGLDPAMAGHRAFANRSYDEAAAYWTADAARRPDRAYTHYMLGLSLWKAERLEEAVAALSRSAELNDGSVRTWVNLSRVLNEQGDHEAALAAAESARMADAENPQALYVQARSLYNLGRDADAEVALEQALAFDPEYGHALNLIGLVRIRGGRYAAAAESLALAAIHEPELSYVHANLGRALELDGRYEEAAVAFRASLDIEPEQPGTQVCLARVESSLSAAPQAPPQIDGESSAVAAVSEPAESAVEGTDGIVN